MIQVRDPELESSMLSRVIGGRWRALDTASRCRYQLMAAKLLSEHKEGNAKRLGNKKNNPPTNSQEQTDAESLYEALKTSNAGNQQIISAQPQEIKSVKMLCEPLCVTRAVTPAISVPPSASFQIPINQICIERQEATFITPSPSPVEQNEALSLVNDYTIPFHLQKMLCEPQIQLSADDLAQERICFSIKTTQAFLDDELVDFASLLGSDCLAREC